MSSGIFAVVNIGSLKLYVGEVHRLKTRWQAIMLQLTSGQYHDCRLQQTWQEVDGQRRFTFHTAKEIEENVQILGRQQFFADLEQRKNRNAGV